MKYWKYLKYIVKHKYYVMIECFKMGIYWRGLTHDMSKFLPSEFFPYANYFYGNYPKLKEQVEYEFTVAWLKHQKRNPHHWQYWLLINDDSSNSYLMQQFDPTGSVFIWDTSKSKHIAEFLGGYEEQLKIQKEIDEKLNKFPVALKMPDEYTKEMLCDWIGAGKAINGFDDTFNWYRKNKRNMLLHPETRKWIEEMMGKRKINEATTGI